MADASGSTMSGSPGLTNRLRRAGAHLVRDAEHSSSADGKGAIIDGEVARARARGATLSAGR